MGSFGYHEVSFKGPAAARKAAGKNSPRGWTSMPSRTCPIPTPTSCIFAAATTGEWPTRRSRQGGKGVSEVIADGGWRACSDDLVHALRRCLPAAFSLLFAASAAAETLSGMVE
jgi:hypothetical protein